jgi:hypothetical protein
VLGGVAVVLAFASAPTAPIFLGPLGWSEIGRLRLWIRPLLAQAAAPAAGGEGGEEPHQAGGVDHHPDAAVQGGPSA